VSGTFRTPFADNVMAHGRVEVTPSGDLQIMITSFYGDLVRRDDIVSSRGPRAAPLHE
jgi:hypothetical protein